MPKPLSMDLRTRVVEAFKGGASRRGIAKQFAVSPSFVIKLVQRFEARGSVEPDQFGGWCKPDLAPHADTIASLVAATPDITIAELRLRLAEDGIATSRSTLGRFLLRLKLTRKKRPGTPPSRSGRTSPPRAKPGARTRRS